MAWLKIIVFSFLVLALGVMGFDTTIALVKLPIDILLTLLIGITGLALLVWLVAVDHSVSKIWKFCEPYCKGWSLYLFEPEIRVKDENCEGFKALSHEQKIKVLQKKYASVPRKFESRVRLRWIVVSGLVSFGVLLLLWQFGQMNTVDTRVFSAAVALLVGAPVALMVWYFRDQNNIRELERQHHDVTLKEFQKLQEWATGNISDGYEDGKKTKRVETLQISALHSLRTYLRGEFGEIFKRSAFEVFVSVLSVEHYEILKYITENSKNPSNFEIQWQIEHRPLARQINQIASEEWFNLLMNHSYSLRGISLLGVSLKNTYLVNLDFTASTMQGVCFEGAELENIDFTRCLLFNADFTNARLKYCNFLVANLISASFLRARFDSVLFKSAEMQLCDFALVKSKHSYFSETMLQATNWDGFSTNEDVFRGCDFSGAFAVFHVKSFKDVVLTRIGKPADVEPLKRLNGKGNKFDSYSLDDARSWLHI
ncbi:pentapeptide repeat-containing protein [Thiomicrorhabdus sediminis]|uniref:Pentapeptide repeat-containing protein n=1 Tax=Thiomicrorhabdus sediminis TaxID=2580412 RepID=A0A4P9K3F1_9GAMM|nr:pentapeptide repeat-containing protein [Thiomicrorhabdus sediminis]QCU89392.1 pentapeptide repeat-containing protein [Thiomicrorhabdus sediminis]